jgi:hypothetical protein
MESMYKKYGYDTLIMSNHQQIRHRNASYIYNVYITILEDLNNGRVFLNALLLQ